LGDLVLANKFNRYQYFELIFLQDVYLCNYGLPEEPVK
jgi:hypothetical protein